MAGAAGAVLVPDIAARMAEICSGLRPWLIRVLISMTWSTLRAAPAGAAGAGGAGAGAGGIAAAGYAAGAPRAGIPRFWAEVSPARYWAGKPGMVVGTAGAAAKGC